MLQVKLFFTRIWTHISLCVVCCLNADRVVKARVLSDTGSYRCVLTQEWVIRRNCTSLAALWHVVQTGSLPTFPFTDASSISPSSWPLRCQPACSPPPGLPAEQPTVCSFLPSFLPLSFIMEVCFFLNWYYREEHQFVVPLIYAFFGWFLYMPWPGIKPTTLAYRDDALTNGATRPGHCVPSCMGLSVLLCACFMWAQIPFTFLSTPCILLQTRLHHFWNLLLL